MRLRDGLGALPPRTVWRFFPLFVALAMSVVIAVNAGMIYAALHTFPGNAGSDGFDLSNHYDRVLDRVARQAAMGWRLTADANASGLPSIVLTDRDGAPLTGARFDAVATRPVGAQMTTQMPFHEVAPGRYLGAVPLPILGQWELRIAVTAGGHDFAATRRVVVR